MPTDDDRPHDHDQEPESVLKFAKKVDEDWKKAARVERDKFAAEAAKRDVEADKNAEKTFTEFIALMLQQVQVDLQRGMVEQAKFMIDALSVLRKRTEGNLTTKELTLLDSTLPELKRIFFQMMAGAGGGMPPGAGAPPAAGAPPPAAKPAPKGQA